MKARIAKKVRRNLRSAWPLMTHRTGTYKAAVFKSLRIWKRSKVRTHGHRWGRWDHTRPSPPWECPF